jgi:hypothetical protein
LTDSLSSPRRYRGAQPGNNNALKHGFYSKQLKGVDLQGLGDSGHTGLSDDIAMLRVYIRRVVDLSQNSQSVTETINALRALCLAYMSLARLAKTQHFLSAGENPIEAALSEALRQVNQELSRLP